jgi:hypothetical protein
MRYQVSRTDTGQFVLTDRSTDTVVIDDDLAAGFAALEEIVATKPVLASAPALASDTTLPDHPRAVQGTSSFRFDGPRYTPILLAVVLPFAWLAVFYFALANLLTDHALDRKAASQTEDKLDALERELQALRSELAGAPRTAKTEAPRAKPKPTPTPTAKPESGASPEPPTADASGPR